MFKLRYLLPLALVTGLLAIPASASADSASATISIAGNATLISLSPGPVAVTVHYSCPNVAGNVFVSIQENGVLVLGSGATSATCDGQNHSATVTVAGAFTPGTATAVAEVSSAGIGSFALAQDAIAIK